MTISFSFRLMGLFAVFFSVIATADPLAWRNDPAFRNRLYQAINQFTGRAKGNYIEPNALISNEIGLALGGPPDPAVTLGNGDTFVSAAMWHEAENRAAVIIDTNVKVVAAALIYIPCYSVDLTHKPYGRCDLDNPRLAIFTNGSLDPVAKQAFLDWANKYDEDSNIHDRVEIRDLHGPKLGSGNGEKSIDDWCATQFAKTGGVTISMREAAEKCYEKWDKQLNTSYQRLMNRLSVADQEKLKDTERAWLTWRTSEAKASNSFIFGPQSGSLALIVADSQGNMFLRRRVLFLEDYEELPNHALNSSVLDGDGAKPNQLDTTFDQQLAAAGTDSDKVLETYSRSTKAWDDELNGKYKEVMDASDLGDERRGLLKQAERDWISWRDKELLLEQSVVSQEIRPNSREALLADYQRLIVRARAIDMESYFKLLDNPP